MKTIFLRLLAFVALVALALPAPALRAQDLGAVKARMAQRLAKLDELKAKGAVGENNRGFVEARAGDPAAGAVISAENSDRESVYAARAKQIASGSAAGVWVQKEDGAWHKK